MLNRLLQWAKQLKREAVTLWFCCRHPQTPWLAKLLAVAIVAYAFSPIDLIPDFIPVLGLLDELVADKPEKAAAPAGDPTGGMGGMDF